MNFDIIVVNIPLRSDSATHTAKSVYLKAEDWIYVCSKCNTWEVFSRQENKESLKCWCCSKPYEKYTVSNSNYS